MTEDGSHTASYHLLLTLALTETTRTAGGVGSERRGVRLVDIEHGRERSTPA